MKTFFGKKLAEILNVTGISQSDLAERSGIGQSNISKIIRGDIEPTFRSAQSIAAALGVSIAIFADPTITPEQPRRGRPPKRQDVQ